MNFCPIKTLKAWTDLVDAVGETQASALWAAYEGSVPDSFYVKQNIDTEVLPSINRISSSDIKPGVKDVFESNPELANSVYEALGFKQKKYASKLKQILERRSLVTKEDLQKSQLIKDIRVDKTQNKDVKPNEFDKNLTSIMLYGHRYNDLSDIDYVDENLSTITNPAEMQMEAETLAYRILNDLLFDIKEITEFYEEIKDNPRYISSLTTNENPVKEFFENDIFDQVEKENIDISLEQKQEALQQYSRYLDQIFPKSKVKDIVYHGSRKNLKLEKFDKSEIGTSTDLGWYGKGFYFYFNVNSASNYGTVNPSIVNIQNPYIFDTVKSWSINFNKLPKNFDGAIAKTDISAEYRTNEELKEIAKKSEIVGFLSKDNDGGHPVVKLTKEEEELIIFEPENIHILGSNSDIEGFKAFVGKSNVLEKKADNSNLNEEHKESLNLIFNIFGLDSNGNIQSGTLEDVQNAILVNELPKSITATKLDNGNIQVLNNGTPITSLFKNNNTEVASKTIAVQQANDILTFLSKKYNIPFELDPNIASLGQYNTSTGVISINPNLVRSDTPFHEFAHPFILMIKQAYPQLYNALIKEVSSNTDLVLKTQYKYGDLTQEGILEEALVQMIGEIAANKYQSKKAMNLVQRMLKFISDILSDVFGIKKNLSLASTINDIAEMLVSPSNKMDLSNIINTLDNSDNYNRLQASDEEVKALEQSIKDAGLTDKDVDEKYKIIERDINVKYDALLQIAATKDNNKNIADRKRILQEQKLALDANKKIASIANYIDTTVKNIDDMYIKYMNVIAPKFSDLNNKTQNELHELLRTLDIYNSFSQNFGALEELVSDPILQHLAMASQMNPSVPNPLGKLQNALEKLKKINSNTTKVQAPLLTKAIILPLTERSKLDTKILEKEIRPRVERTKSDIKRLENNKLEMLKNGKSTESIDKKIASLKEGITRMEEILVMQDFDENAIVKMMSTGVKDISMLDMLLTPVISSPDTILASFAKFLKEKFIEVRRKLIREQNEIGLAYEKFAAKNGKKFTSDEEFKDFIEIIEVPLYDADGNIVGNRRVKKLIEEIDKSKFNKARSEMYNRVEKKFGLQDSKEKTAAIASWYKENTEPVDAKEIEEMTNYKQKQLKDGILTQEEYDDWYDSVVQKTFTNEIIYKREFSRPKKSLYSNRKYQELQLPQNAHKKEFYDWYVKKYLSLQEMLPPAHQRGLTVPSVDKGFKNRVFENGAKRSIEEYFTDFTKYQAKDQQYGKATYSGQLAQDLPVYFTQDMNGDDVSSDLIGSLMLFTKMAEEYNMKNSYSGEINAMVNVIRNRKYQATNSKWGVLKDKFSEAVGLNKGIIKSDKSTANSTKQFLDFIDNVIYGKTSEKMEVWGIALDKVLDKLMGFQATTALGGWRPLKQIANTTQANVMAAIEAAAKEFLDFNSLARGKKYYYNSLMKDIMPDIVNKKLTGKSLPTQIIEYFDAIQGDFMNELGKNVTGNIAKKMINGNPLFFLQNMSEHEAQVSAFFGMLDFIKVKQNGKEISLLDAFELGKDGLIKLKDGVEFSEQDMVNVEMRVHALSKRMHGVYNSFDRPSIQKDAIGRSLIMFRKFMPPGFKRRFKSAGYDSELNGVTEGFYRSFYTLVKRGVTEYNGNIAKSWAELTPVERANSRRFVVEVSTMILFTTLAVLISGYADDEKDDLNNYDDFTGMAYNKAVYGSEYLAIRLASEMKTYLPIVGIPDMLRILSSPSVSTTLLEKVLRAVSQSMPWNVTEAYERKQGLWEKGDNKALAKWLSLFGITGNEINPEYATKNFKRFL